MGKRSMTLFVVALVALGGLATPAHAGRLQLTFALTSHEPGTSTGAVLHLVYPDDGPGGKPKPVSGGVYEFPSGTRFDGSALPVCSASDQDFQVQGFGACAPDTALGGGGLTVDTGFGPPIDPMALDDRYFHGPGELVTVFTPHDADRPVMQVNRLKIQGSTIIDHPSLPPGYPPGTKTVAKQVDQHIDSVSRAGRAFMTTPRTCPPTREWISRLTIVYEDGSVDSATSATSCRGPSAAPSKRRAHRRRRHVPRRRHVAHRHHVTRRRAARRRAR
jgi:hypothetical protein